MDNLVIFGHSVIRGDAILQEIIHGSTTLPMHIMFVKVIQLVHYIWTEPVYMEIGID